MTILKRIGQGLMIAGLVGAVGGLSVVAYKQSTADDALVTEQAQRANELEVKLNSNVNISEILANHEIYRQFTNMQQEYNSLMAMPEVKTQIENYKNEKQGTDNYLFASIFLAFPLIMGGVSIRLLDKQVEARGKEQLEAFVNGLRQ